MGWRCTKSLIGAGEHHHERDGDDHRRDHDRDLVDHADRGDDRVEREDDVEQHDLHDHRRNDAALTAAEACALLALELVVDLVGALADQEQAARDQDEVAARDLRGRRP